MGGGGVGIGGLEVEEVRVGVGGGGGGGGVVRAEKGVVEPIGCGLVRIGGVRFGGGVIQ